MCQLDQLVLTLQSRQRIAYYGYLRKEYDIVVVIIIDEQRHKKARELGRVFLVQRRRTNDDGSIAG